MKMNEFKRTLCSKNIVLLFLILCFLSAGYELFDLSGNTVYREEYQKKIEKYSFLSEDECSQLIENEHKDNEAFLYAYYLDNDDFYSEQEEKIIRDKCEELYGSDYESVLKSMNLSEAEHKRIIMEENALHSLEIQLDYIKNYPLYLESVHANAQKGSLKVFAQNEYNKRNSLKTDEDYPDSAEIQLCLTPVESFNNFVCDNFDAYCSLIFSFAILIKFNDEKKRGLRSLVYGCRNGRTVLAVKRIMILAFGSVFGGIAISFCRLIACVYEYGRLPELSLAVQSSPEFKQFVFRLSFGQVLFYDLLLKTVGTFVVSAFFWMLMQVIRNYKLSVIVAGIVFAAEYVLLYYVPDSYSLISFRFANVLALIDTKRIFLKYLNIDFFGYPVTGCYITIAFGVLTGILCMTAVIVSAEKLKPVKPLSYIPAAIKKAQNVWFKIRANVGLTVFEIRKMLLYQRGALVIVVLLLIIRCYGNVPPSDSTMYDSSLAVWAGSYSGEITQDTLDVIDNEIAEIKTLESDILRSDTLRLMYSFKADAQSKYEENRGLWLLNQAPYASLFGIGEHQRKWGLIAFAFTILLVTGLFSYEKQSRMVSIMLSTPKGRKKIVTRKILISVAAAAFVWLCISGNEIYETYRYFGNFTETMQAPLASIDYFRENTSKMTIGQYLILYFLAKLLCLSTVALSCCVISLYTENTNNAIIISVLLLLFPGCIALLGVSFAEYCSFIRLWSPIEAGKIGYIICAVLIPALIYVLYKNSNTIRKVYGEKKRRYD